MVRLAGLAVLVGVGLVGCGDNKVGARPPDAGPTLDAGSDPIPLGRAHAGGNPSALVIVDGKAYVAVGPRLAVWDLATGTLVGESAPLRGVIDAVAVVGPRAFVAERTDVDALLHVLDVSNPAAIVETRELDLSPDPAQFSVIHDLEPGPNNRLYVSDQEQGVFELDITNPDEPMQVRLAPVVGVGELQLSGTRLYHYGGGLGGTSLGALDTTMMLKTLGQANLPVEGVALAGASGNLAVGAGVDGIFVFDVTNLNNPVQRFQYSRPDGGPFARAVTAAGTRAWIPADDGLHVLDLARPAQITRTLHAHDVAGVNAVTVGADTLAIATDRGQLHTFDVAAATPASPHTLDITLCADCVGIATRRDGDAAITYITDIVGGLRTARLSDLAALGTSPAIPAAPEAGGLAFVFEDVEVDATGTRAYVADWLFGLRIYDVSDPSTIAEVGTLDTPGAPSGVAIAGDRAFLSEGTGGGFLRAIDIADPARPSEIGWMETSKSLEVEVVGNLAYVANEELFAPGGLQIVDVSNPAQLAPVGLYNQDCLNARDVALVGAYAIVACSFDGFHLVDVRDPAQPTRVAVIPAPGIASAWSVAAQGDHVALGHDRGVTVMDITTPSSPREVAAFATAFTVRALDMPAPGRIVAAAGYGGVYQWQLEN